MLDVNPDIPKETPAPPGRLHAILALLLVTFVIAKIILVLVSPKSKVRGSDLSTDNILQAVNRERSLRNLLTLNTNSMLGTAAQSKADDMQARHYFAHVDPDGNYIWPKITAAGYTPYLQLGENLAIEFYDTESLVTAWMNSPTHRANILNDGFRDQGMGMDFGDSSAGQYHSAVVNTFGTLAAKKTLAAPLPATGEVTAQSVSGAATPTLAPAPPPAGGPKPKPTSVKKHRPPAPAPLLPAAPAAVPEQAGTAAPAEPIQAEPVSPRGDFTLALNNSNAPAAATSSTPAGATSNSSPAVINTAPAPGPQNPQINRYFTFAFGIVLLLFLMTDLGNIIEAKSAALGKKMDNLLLLFLALAVIAVFYWF